MTSRGMIIGTDLLFDCRDGTCNTGGHPDVLRQNIRRWCLFWDRLAIMDNPNTIRVNIDELDFLQNAGLLTRYDVEHMGGEISQTIQTVNMAGMEHFEKEEPGKWGIDLSLGSLHAVHPFFSEEETLKDRGIVIELQNVIPVPDKDVPLADILEFREKRKSEMLALRHHIDDLQNLIANSKDPAFTLNSKKEAIEQAANDAIKVIRERRIPFRLSTQAASFNFIGATALAASSYYAQLPLLTVFGNFVLGGITVGAAVEWKSRKKLGDPFSYVTDYHHHLFLE